MREEFELWHRKVVAGNPPHEKYNNGDYRNEHVQRYWLGWQASRWTLVIELPKADSDDGESWDQLWKYGVKQCRQAIEAAGVKVKQ